MFGRTSATSDDAGTLPQSSRDRKEALPRLGCPLPLHREVKSPSRNELENRGLGWDGVPFDRGTPLLTHLSAAVKQLREAEGRGESVAIHCSAGCGRSVRLPSQPHPCLLPSELSHRLRMQAAVVVTWLCARGGEGFDSAVARLAALSKTDGVRRQPLEVGEQALREACDALRGTAAS